MKITFNTQKTFIFLFLFLGSDIFKDALIDSEDESRKFKGIHQPTFCEKLRNIECHGCIKKYIRVSSKPPRYSLSRKRKAEPQEGDFVKIQKVQKTIHIDTSIAEDMSQLVNYSSTPNVIDALLNSLKRRYIDAVEIHFENVWNSQFGNIIPPEFADLTIPDHSEMEPQGNNYQHCSLPPYQQQYQNGFHDTSNDNLLLTNDNQNNLIQDWMNGIYGTGDNFLIDRNDVYMDCKLYFIIATDIYVTIYIYYSRQYK